MPTQPLPLKDWRFEIDFENIAWAIFDRENESMNSLGTRPFMELAEIVEFMEGAAARNEVRGLIIMSGKESGFIAGADIRDFANFKTESDVSEAVKNGIEVFDRLEKLKVPVVAAIRGVCLGGGLELALACHYRIADRDDGTRFAFPEVKLGIYPGLNGTVRALRQCGALSAMDAMLTGRMIKPASARAMGFVDELVPNPHKLRWAARKAVLSKRRSKGPAFWKKLLVRAPIRGYLAGQMRKKTAAKVREDHYPAPFRLIDLFEKFGDDYKRLKAAETPSFAKLMVSDTSRNLRRVFHLSETLKSQAPQNGFKPQRVHVIGAGTMGADIAAWCVVCGMEVSLQDLSAEAIEKAIKRSKKLFQKRLRKKVAIDAALARLIPDVEGKNVPRADVVIEAIVENLEIKQKVFSGLEDKLKPGAILATNTSSLPIEDIAAGLKDPGRLIGLHFFNPVAQLPLVEVVQGENSRSEEVEKGCTMVTAIKKFPLIVKSCPGFLVNRVLAPYMFAGMSSYQEGVSREKIDQSAVQFGMPMGPLELADVVGLDVCKHVADVLGLSANDDSELVRMIKNQKLGKKTGEGFYVWENGKPKKKDEEFPASELDRFGKELIAPMLAECEKCLDDKIVADADLIDAGVIFGTGFAPFRGGPMHYLQNAPTDASKGASKDGPSQPNIAQSETQDADKDDIDPEAPTKIVTE